MLQSRECADEQDNQKGEHCVNDVPVWPLLRSHLLDRLGHENINIYNLHGGRPPTILRPFRYMTTENVVFWRSAHIPDDLAGCWDGRRRGLVLILQSYRGVEKPVSGRSRATLYPQQQNKRADSEQK